MSHSIAQEDSLRALAKRVLRMRAVGVPATVVLSAVGVRRGSRRIAQLCGYMPATVRVRLDARHAFLIRSADGLDQYAASVWNEGWDALERPMPQLFAALAGHEAARGALVLDVGANTGFYALVSAAMGACVHAFEPFPTARRWLEENIALNGFGDRIVVVAAAISSQEGSAKLYVPVPRFKAIETSASLESGFRPEHAQEIEVPVHTLDGFVRGLGGGAARVGLMKVDVEGHEPAVFAGALSTLREHRPWVTVEVLDDAAGEKLDEAITRSGYAVLRMRPSALVRAERLRGDGPHTNQLLCPPERLEELRPIARAIGLMLEA